MQNLDLSPVDQILNATSRKFDAELDGCDALVIPTNAMAYGKAFFRVSDDEITLLTADGSDWDQYDMPEDGDVVAYIENLLSSFGF
jgi:hypothetical protein